MPMFRLGKLELGKIPRIAVSFDDRVSTSAIQTAKRLGMDIAELRVDLFVSKDLSHVVKQALKFKNIPTIATVRSSLEGGRWKNAAPKRLQLYQALLPHVSGIDIEYSSSSLLRPLIRQAKKLKKTVIVSYHHFSSTPALTVLEKKVQDAKKAGADIVKIATLARGAEDLLVMSALTLRHWQKGLITICMGKEGAFSRIVFPQFGSLITFARFKTPSAPGQIELKKLASLLKNRLL